MNILVKNISDMTSTEYAACYKANYGTDGYMQEELQYCRWYPDRRAGKVIMMWDGPADKVSSLKAWALLTEVRTHGLLAVSSYIKRVSKYSVQLWVKRQYRGRGYSKILMNEVIRLDPKPNVFPHDRRSASLYSQYSVSCAKYDRDAWLRKPSSA